MTYFTRNLDVGQEIHLDGFIAITATGFATAAFHIEGETPWFITSDFGFRKIDKQTANITEYSCVGSWVASRCPTQRRLVDVDYLVDIFQPLNAVVRHGPFEGTVEMLGENGLQGFVDKS